MRLQVLRERFTVCKLDHFKKADLSVPFCFLSHTDEECSLVCPTAVVPAETLAREDGWKAFRVEGELDFGLVGILSAITSLLAEKKIPVFAVSTYNTDYVFLKEDKLPTALWILSQNGYQII